MRLGIKTGLPNDTFGDLDATGARTVEIWFDASRSSEYTDMLENLKSRGIAVGIHYWGALHDGTWTTLAYPDKRIISESLDLMKRTIDIAVRYNASYVNIHPGTRAQVALDFTNSRYTVLSEPAAPDDALRTFLENVTKLSDYATTRNVLLTVETVPARVYDHWEDTSGRINAKNAYEMPYEAVERAADIGISVANDFGHTAAQSISTDSAKIRQFLIKATKRLAPATKLIHLGFLVPPYNGTDFHDHLDHPEFGTNRAIPDRSLMIKLLKIIIGKNPGVYIIPEPVSDHRKNFFLARDIVGEALKTPE